MSTHTPESTESAPGRTSRVVGEVDAGFAEAGVSVSQGLFFAARRKEAQALERAASPAPRKAGPWRLPRYIPVRPDIDRGVAVAVTTPTDLEYGESPRLPTYIPVTRDVSLRNDVQIDVTGKRRPGRESGQ